jgi:hypothetical protein
MKVSHEHRQYSVKSEQPTAKLMEGCRSPINFLTTPKQTSRRTGPSSRKRSYRSRVDPPASLYTRRHEHPEPPLPAFRFATILVTHNGQSPPVSQYHHPFSQDKNNLERITNGNCLYQNANEDLVAEHTASTNGVGQLTPRITLHQPVYPTTHSPCILIRHQVNGHP